MSQRHRMFPLTMIIILSGVLFVAWFKQGSAGHPRLPRVVELSTPWPPPDFVTVGDFEKLQDKVGVLEKKVDDFGRQTVQVPMPAPEVGRLEAKVVQLKSKVGDLTELLGKVDAVPNHIEELKDRIGAIEETLGKVEIALRPAANLFREWNYSTALDAFRKLQQDHPKDARVWYYSALAYGISKNKWDSEALIWVKKGVECERARNPEVARIDAEFAGLTQETGKVWLDFYRRTVNRGP